MNEITVRRPSDLAHSKMFEMNYSMITFDPVAWINGFFTRRSLNRPDARPLYSYRCSDDEFEEMGDILRSRAKQPIGRVGAALFCLYAAEWWRRNHRGGSWKWAGILDDTGRTSISFPQLYKIVENGLRYWQREILRVGSNRGFLVTLACEGGLPLHLVNNEGTALRRYLLGVLEDFQLFRSSGYKPEDIASGASALLPFSLQQDVVYRLSGQLIDEIWKLQPIVGNSHSPVRDLDRTDPNWREQLPLIVPDNVADTLLNPLIKEAVELARGGVSGLRMHRSLRVQGENWTLHAEVVVPASVSDQQLVKLFGDEAANLLGRFELYLKGKNDNRSPLAIATQTDHGDQKKYRFEPFEVTRHFKGEECCVSKSLHVITRSVSIGPRPLPGGYSLTDLPWVFVDKSGEHRELRFLGQGSITTRHSEAFVAVPWDTEPENSEGCDCELVAEIQDIERAVFRVRGSATFRDSGGSVCRIRTASEAEASPEYQLNGEVLSGVTGNELVYRGYPTLHEIGTEGQVNRIAPERIEWCIPGKQPSIWRPLSPECYGEVTLRFVDNSMLRYRDHVMIVPKEAEIQLQPSPDFKRGQIDLVGFEDVEVGWKSIPGDEIRLEKIAINGLTRLVCEASSEPPAEISLHLTWPGGRKLAFDLPYPSSGGRFISSSGRVFPDEETVPLDRLSGIIATGTTTDEQCQYFVSGTLLRAQDISPTQRFEVREPLTKVIDGRFELDLCSLQEPLRNLFALSRDLDVRVRLVIEASGSLLGSLRRLIVSRFDLSLMPDRRNDEVRLEEDAIGRLNWENIEHLKVEAVRLWDPETETSVLKPVPGSLAPGRWLFSSECREPGPWMILGKDGDWHRIRPLLWEVPGKDDQLLLQHFDPKEGGVLAKVVCISNKNARVTALDRVIDALSEDYDHEDWHQVYAFLRRFRGLPATTLDLTDRFISSPHAAAMALLGVPDTSIFSLIWSLLEELPFLWSLLPVRDWVMAGKRFESSLRGRLEGYPGDVDALVREALSCFLNEAPKCQLGFETLTDLMRVGVLKDEIESTRYLKMVVSPEGRDALRNNLERVQEELLHRHAGDDDIWPTSNLFSNWFNRAESLPEEIKDIWHIEPPGTHYRSSVINAPAVAAIAAACGIKVERSLVYEIRRLRSFDEEWFNYAYSFMLTIAIGILFEQDPIRIGVNL